MSGRVFFYAELKAATKEFNCRNFLGQGGFGRVYKGFLKCRQEVVVKRLVQNGEEKQDKASKKLTRRLLCWDVSDIPIWCRWWATANMKMKGCWCANTCRAATLENIFVVQNNET
uniref:non-specific serine/threonine protein kinase n=1 Tax=Lactuca sativa TaxID=4236 RepID=A0A9R1XDE6_LACSA|nr:hypothetical protein LSAT_V11C500249940 [Lactuca sativa]